MGGGTPVDTHTIGTSLHTMLTRTWFLAEDGPDMHPMTWSADDIPLVVIIDHTIIRDTEWKIE
jgi:hypothetical protein